MKDVEVHKVVEYAGEDADITLQLKHLLTPMIQEAQLDSLLKDVEIPLMHVYQFPLLYIIKENCKLILVLKNVVAPVSQSDMHIQHNKYICIALKIDFVIWKGLLLYIFIYIIKYSNFGGVFLSPPP